MKMTLAQELKAHADKKQARLLQGFFKTGPGEYGEGDMFLGLKVPLVRSIAKKYAGMPLHELEKYLASNIHEERLAALLLLVEGSKKNPKESYDFYLAHLSGVNNWDLVDLSAPYIVGRYLLVNPQEKGILWKLAKSNTMWERRVAIVATSMFIRAGNYQETLKIAHLLLRDKHDLIHKAVGWMLREIGKKNVEVLEKFLKTHYQSMPRTMLRYAIERFPDEKRKRILSGTMW